MDIEDLLNGLELTEQEFLHKGYVEQGGYLLGYSPEIQSAHCFNFEFDAIAELREFGVDMLEKKLFRLPFQRVLYKFPIFKDGKLNSSEKIGNSYAFVQEGKREGDWEFISVSKFRDLPPFSDFTGKFSHHGEVRRTPEQMFIPIALVGPFSQRIKALGPEREARSNNELAATVFSIIGLTMALMSKDVETKKEVISEKLNAKRKKKGKAALLDHHVVRIKKEAIEREYEKRGAIEKATARMHWRRGHFRTLPDGKIVPVAPCIVNKNSENAVTKEYKVTN